MPGPLADRLLLAGNTQTCVCSRQSRPNPIFPSLSRSIWKSRPCSCCHFLPLSHQVHQQLPCRTSSSSANTGLTLLESFPSLASWKHFLQLSGPYRSSLPIQHGCPAHAHFLSCPSDLKLNHWAFTYRDLSQHLRSLSRSPALHPSGALHHSGQVRTHHSPLGLPASSLISRASIS